MASDSASDAGTFDASQFKDVVKEYIKIFDRIAELRRDSSMLNKRKKKLSETIVSFMSNNDKEICNLGTDGSLQVKTSKSTLALKKDQVELLLQQLGNDETKAKETAQFLWENKTVKERKVLKRNIRPLQ
jgi:seryl-tRNA synthetase|tara:strand:+ start:210 stop:599 length:390 start_codon:yes stop_codon:yes gene_type:complete